MSSSSSTRRIFAPLFSIQFLSWSGMFCLWIYAVPVITRDQVRYAKPDPDLFLAAAARLDVSIRDSLVVGDGYHVQIRAVLGVVEDLGGRGGAIGGDRMDVHVGLAGARTGAGCVE